MTVREKIRFLPESPGVYRYFNEEGTVIYVGKAKNLKKRVSQYFVDPERLNRKTRAMVSKIADLQYTVVESEQDAFLLENNLIKQFQPRYNILLKDSKTYPWICIRNENFPRVFTTRRTPRDGSRYYGPYSSSTYANGLVTLFHTLFQLRTCKHALTPSEIASKAYRPCLNAHIGKCRGCCAGKISPEEYSEQIEAVEAILKGETSSLIRSFKAGMMKAASEMRFEEAQQMKEKLELLQNHYDRTLVTGTTAGNVDVFSVVMGQDEAYGNFLRVHNGSIIQSFNVEYRLGMEQAEEDVLDMLIGEIYSRLGDLSKEIIVPFMPAQELQGHDVHVPERGDKAHLLALSKKNAALLKLDRERQEEVLRPDEHRQKTVEQLRKDLSMDVPPRHIECFDNSNIQGTNPVASCVVFRDGVPSKKEYRHFIIKTVVGANDFASMKEVLNRRYSRLLAEGEELPDLIVVDGGKGQLTLACEALDELGLLGRIKIVGLAKRLEEIIVPGDPYPLFLDKNSTSLKVLCHIRDEAHRFGITHHRNRRSKAQIQSELRRIPGVGEKTEMALLGRFKSVARLKKATKEQIAGVTGPKLASAVYEYFNGKELL